MNDEFDFIVNQLNQQTEKLERIRLALGVPKGGPLLEDVAAQFRQYAQAWSALSDVIDSDCDPLIAANKLRRFMEKARGSFGVDTELEF
jgi:hypothetical protein